MTSYRSDEPERITFVAVQLMLDKVRECGNPVIAQFFAQLTPRQIRVAAAHLDGATQAQIAEQLDIDQATVSRDLQCVRATCKRFGRTLPGPMRMRPAEKVQLSDRLYSIL